MSARHLTWAETTPLAPGPRAPVATQRFLLMLMVSASNRETPDRAAKPVDYYASRMGVSDRTVRHVLAALAAQDKIATGSRVGGRARAVEWWFHVTETVIQGSAFVGLNGEQLFRASPEPPFTPGVNCGTERVNPGVVKGEPPFSQVPYPVSPSLSPSRAGAPARVREGSPEEPEREIEVTSLEALRAMRALEARLRMPDDDDEEF